MAQIVIVLSIMAVFVAAARSRGDAFGVFIFVLLTHGMFVHFFGAELHHLPFFTGLATIPVVLFGSARFKVDWVSLGAVALFFVAIVLSLLASADIEVSMLKAIAYVKPLLVCLLLAGALTSKLDLSRAASYVVIAAVTGAMFNLYQQITGSQISYNEWDTSLSRAASLRADPNDTAMLLLAALPIAYYKIVNASKAITRLLYLACAGGIVIGIIMTGSRAGFVVLVSVGVAIMLHNPRVPRHRVISWPSPRNLVLALILGVAAFIAAPGYYWDRMATLMSGQEVGGAQSLYDRKTLLVQGIDAWLENPIFGAGVGQFHNSLYGSYATSPSSERKAVAHNMYLEFLVESGVVGLMAFLSIVFIAIRRFILLDRETFSFNEERYIGYGFAGGTFAMLVMGMTLSQGYNPILWCFLGCGLASKRWVRPTSKQLRRRL